MYDVARRVVVLDKESGEVVLTVGGRAGSEPGQLSSPTGLAVEPSSSSSEGGRKEEEEEPALLWVLDAGNTRLQAFDKATGATTRTSPHQLQAGSHEHDSHRQTRRRRSCRDRRKAPVPSPAADCRLAGGAAHDCCLPPCTTQVTSNASSLSKAATPAAAQSCPRRTGPHGSSSSSSRTRCRAAWSCAATGSWWLAGPWQTGCR